MKIFGRRNDESRGIQFPKPDRSDFHPSILPEDGAIELDLGWAEGEFKDGRPFRAELWSWENLSVNTFISFYFSSAGLENAPKEALADLLQRELSMDFKEEKEISVRKIEDSAGNEMWSIAVLIRRDGEDLVTVGLRFNSYPRPQKK